MSEALPTDQLTALAAAAEHFRGRPEGMTLGSDVVAALVRDLTAARAEVERLRNLLGIEGWPAGMQPANVVAIAAEEVRRLVESERDAARAELADARRALDEIQRLCDVRAAVADGQGYPHTMAVVRWADLNAVLAASRSSSPTTTEAAK